MIQEVEKFLREHMDMNDDETSKTIAHVMMEDNKDNELLAALTNELYNKIQEKATRIDYGTISKSRGDITRIENYITLTETLDIIHNIVVEYKQDTEPVDVVLSAIENIKTRKDLFIRAFTINASLPILLYNNIVYAIVASVSFLIATCIEFIKSPNVESFKIALDAVAYRRTKDNLLFNSLKLFNESCNSSELDSSLNTIMNKRVSNESTTITAIHHDSPFMTDEEIEFGTKSVIHDDTDDEEGEIHEDFLFSITKAVIFGIRLVINLLRGLVYYFFNTKQRISDYFAIQAELLEMNAYKLQYSSSVDEASRKKIYDKQMKIANKFRNWANKFSIDYNVSKNKVDSQMDEDSRKYKVSELDSYNPNEETKDPYVNSVLF